MYLTAGIWAEDPSPPSAPRPRAPGARRLTRNLAVADARVHYGGAAARAAAARPPANNDTVYTAELWKSTDGGKTWVSLFSSTGEFYFNDIDCADDEHCVAVGEGFVPDGSTNPGARVYITSDGKKLSLVHHAKAEGASLVAARMLSREEHWAGGAAGDRNTSPILALHSTDGGKSYVDEGATSGVVGHAITTFDFASSSRALATTVNVFQICSLLEYGPKVD
jgi:photosystem II stability/assembly factor-like uncharacterized protein